MRKLRLLLPLLFLASGAVLAAGITISPTTRFEWTDCAAGGSASQTVYSGSYLLRVTDADVFICFAATCATGGEKFPVGTIVLLVYQANIATSCRSTGATADVILTRAQ